MPVTERVKSENLTAIVLYTACYDQALLMLLEDILQDNVNALEHMIIVSSSSPAYIRAELLLSQKRLMSNGLNSKESLDKGEAIERILAAGNSSRSGFQMFCHGHVDLRPSAYVCHHWCLLL